MSGHESLYAAVKRADEATSRVHDYLRGIGAVTPDDCEAAIWTIHDELRAILAEKQSEGNVVGAGEGLSQTEPRVTHPGRDIDQEEPCTSATPTTAARDSEATPATPTTAPAGESSTGTEADGTSSRTGTSASLSARTPRGSAQIPTDPFGGNYDYYESTR